MIDLSFTDIGVIQPGLCDVYFLVKVFLAVFHVSALFGMKTDWLGSSTIDPCIFTDTCRVTVQTRSCFKDKINSCNLKVKASRGVCLGSVYVWVIQL